MLECLGHPCQEQPSTNTGSRSLRYTRSGRTRNARHSLFAPSKCRLPKATFALRNFDRLWQSSGMAKAPAVKWTREHFLIALNLYCKLPFGKLHKGNPIIIEIADKMGRSANSLAMKLCNFASLD